MDAETHRCATNSPAYSSTEHLTFAAMRVFQYRRAGAVVVDGDKVLLCTMLPPHGRQWWHFPGGGIDEGETPLEAAKRELLEETGLRAVAAREYLRAGVHGGEHHYFLVTCDDLTVGPVTGPELEYAAGQDFRAEWVPISELASIPVWPRCVAEHLASAGVSSVETEPDDVPWFEDDRDLWAGHPDPPPGWALKSGVRAVIASAGQVAAIERHRDGERYFTLPGGGVEPGESIDDAVVREVREEVGLDVTPGARLAVVPVRRGPGAVTLHNYVWCDVVGGTFGSGTGDEFTDARRETHGSYRPLWLDTAALPPALKPDWLADRLPRWLDEPNPPRPERFNEHYDD